ncbi:MAG TPA: CHAT domain-containing protein [Candidatus Acidoferrales bacterium]
MVADERERNQIISSRPSLFTVSVVQQLSEAVRGQLRIEPRQALKLAQSALFIARSIQDPAALGSALRSNANARHMVGDNRESLELSNQALEIFRQLGDKSEIARTLNASIQPLILLGDYQAAFRAAAEAKTLFKQLRDNRHLGHVQINLGNIFHRQDRFEEALACYENAYKTLLSLKDTEGLAVALSNMSVSLISLNDFDRALLTYGRARKLCTRHKISILLTQTDYNIAYLYYLRGEYGRAIELLRQTRQACEENGDAHVLALCDLDLSEIYLELNLSDGAAGAARESVERFHALGMGYEEAKSVTNQAIALGQQGRCEPALELFRRARAIFVQEKNQVWPWLIDLYRGLVLLEAGRDFEAKRYCNDALGYFRTAHLPSKTVLCDLLLSELALRSGDRESARTYCEKAVSVLSSDLPILQFQIEFMFGRIEESLGKSQDAYDHFRKARDGAESLRSKLYREELKIAFIKDKADVYEHLVDLSLSGRVPSAGPAEAFAFMDQAKSRNLAEVVFSNIFSTSHEGAEPSKSGHRLRELREELNWYYRRIEIEQLSADANNRDRIQDLQAHATLRENAILRSLRDLPHSEAPPLASFVAGEASVSKIQSGLEDGQTLIEYFGIQDRLVAAIISRDTFEIVPVTSISRVSQIVESLRFQFSKFQLGAEYVRRFYQSMIRAANGHLKSLHDELILPLQKHLSAKHLIIVPHGLLHHVPFQALTDGDKYLIDSFEISYAPSAAIRDMCGKRRINKDSNSLIFGLPDQIAPFIRDEVEIVADILPNARVYMDDQATEAVLKEQGRLAQYIHIATHGKFRADNPMFSGVRLGESYLNVHDLYKMRLPADLITLSGCATGLNSVLAGDELVGLARGLLAAGPRALLLSLWDVNDESACLFMRHFYTQLISGCSKVNALAQAMREVRNFAPHPYYWAPFVLMGHA